MTGYRNNCQCAGHQRHDPNPDCPQHGLDAQQPRPAWVAAMDSWDADFEDMDDVFPQEW